jgi:DNA-binding GntR family transcriptional regulator
MACERLPLWPASVVAVDDDDRSIYLEIAANVRQRIQCGEIRPGHPAPSIESLCQEFDTAPETVGHAMRLLEDEGLVRSHPGRGYYVATP